MTERIVFASKGGAAFHGSGECRALESAQMLSDADCGCDPTYCRCHLPQIHAITPMTVPEAMGAGKLPCLVCLPGWSGAWFRSPSEDDFGHQPVTGYLPDYLGEWTVCARCEVRRAQTWLDRETDGMRVWRFERPVLWPCTSALVLGLVPREVAS